MKKREMRNGKTATHPPPKRGALPRYYKEMGNGETATETHPRPLPRRRERQ
jgi:hypothetical protein